MKTTSFAWCAAFVTLFAAAKLCAQADPKAAPTPPEPIKASTIYVDRINEVYCAMGRVTTLVFDSTQKVDEITLGAPILAVVYDRKLNQVAVRPLITEGETNVNLRIGKDVFVVLVKIVTDVRVQYRRTFTLPGEADNRDAEALQNARPMKPYEVDLLGAVKTLERARLDTVFRAANPDLRSLPVGKVYTWNRNAIYFVDVTQFLEKDLLVFKLEWVNQTDTALYLDVTQYGLQVANRRVPIIAKYQKAVNSVVYPGQHEIVYLAVQGLRLQRDNDWELTLPPDASAVRRMLKP